MSKQGHTSKSTTKAYRSKQLFMGTVAILALIIFLWGQGQFDRKSSTVTQECDSNRRKGVQRRLKSSGFSQIPSSLSGYSVELY
ncbi:hypothetical protein R0V13_04465 [Facklamia hominis]|uniref:hypothetical protein n=1 Tax=Facklamia hominis TaxID=178214 RepID=UPI0029D41C22|nr:hypothetical protein [Facklamia hominis]WPJ91615.1 hypothetical protein R0V13_04465 [Facklamia hominis]